MPLVRNEIRADARPFFDSAQQRRLGVVGMSHHTASLEEIGRCPLRTDQQVARDFCADFFDEYVVLATCNRVEVYFHSARTGPRKAAERFLARLRETSPHARVGSFYNYSGTAAARHLFAIASGIDSLVIGETEILSQVRAAGRSAGEEGTCGPFLERLFLEATAFGKAVRRTIPISEGVTSVADLAFAEAARGGSLGGNEVLLCGAGEIGSKVGALLMKKDPPRTTYLLGRKASRLRALREALRALRPGADVRTVSSTSLQRVLGRVDVVVSAATTDSHVIRAADVPTSRTDLLFIDLGVPANIDPSVVDPPRRIRRVAMDDLLPVIAGTLRARRKLIPAVRAAIAKAVSAGPTATVRV